MKIIIVGGGITGLYLGYLFKKHNIDFNIYERADIVGGKISNKKISNNLIKYQIYPHYKNMINLLNELDVNYKLSKNILPKKDLDVNLFNKIKTIYSKNPIKNISVDTFLKEKLSQTEYTLFLSYITDLKLDKMDISDYFKYNHDNILLTNQSTTYINIDYNIITKLSQSIQDYIYLNHNVQEITYMPLTNNYVLKINDIYINADVLILTTNMNIKLKIPPIIQSQFNKIKSYNVLQIISKNNNNLYKLVISNDKLASSLIKQKFNIDKYSYINWQNAYHINQSKIKTNFYSEYKLILAIHPYLYNLEGSCICAINTFNIIQKNIYKKLDYLYTYK